MSYKPPRKLRGLTADASDDVVSELQAIALELGRRQTFRQRLIESSAIVQISDLCRCLVGSAGFRLFLPAPSVQNQQGEIMIMYLRGSTGTLTLEPKGGTIDGTSTATITATGLYHLRNDAVDWYSDIR